MIIRLAQNIPQEPRVWFRRFHSRSLGQKSLQSNHGVLLRARLRIVFEQARDIVVVKILLWHRDVFLDKSCPAQRLPGASDVFAAPLFCQGGESPSS